MIKRIALIGSSGVIGQKTLNVVRSNPDLFCISSLVCGGNLDQLKKDALEFSPGFLGAALSDKELFIGETRVEAGQAVLSSPDAYKDADIIVIAVTGYAALPAVVEAVKTGKRIALANKESIVCTGSLITELAKKHGTEIIPVDSEHSAIFQCLLGRSRSEVSKIILTASGGALRDMPYSALKKATVKDALRHPTWKMGAKITVDSASMANKGLEIIEARWLFDQKNIDYIIHPESVIHSMIKLKDTTVIAAMSNPDMELPIQYALSYPDRVPSSVAPLDFAKMRSLNFFAPDEDLFPMPKLARLALEAGGWMPAVYNSANEAANDLFCKGRIGFLDIPILTAKALSSINNKQDYTLNDIYNINDLTKEYILSDYSNIIK